MNYIERLAAANPVRCAPRGVYGLEQVARVRLAGRKPTSVHVHLVEAIDRTFSPFAWRSGALSIEVSPDADLSAIDFRPLVGLDVYLCGSSVDKARFKKLAGRIWDVPTKLLAVSMPTRAGEALFVRRGTEVERYPA